MRAMIRAFLFRKSITGLGDTSCRRYSTRSSLPLRVLFCGSDEFSIASLRALNAEHKQNPGLVESIDVLCRPGKPIGRNLKHIREAPIKAVAQELDLPVHERDTFTGWQLPSPSGEPINLIIAVSFGLFVPPRILKSAKYGGLNVHPSLLPKFRGPAPLQHTIIAGEKYTGVTLQTLDDKTFDHGIILDQTPFPGFPLPSGHKCTYQELLDFVTPKAAEMLVQGVRNCVFVPPLHDVGVSGRTGNLNHAPKITQKDRQIQWDIPNAAIDIARRYRALGRLWTETYDVEHQKKRILCEGIEEVDIEEALQQRQGEMTPVGLVPLVHDVGDLSLRKDLPYFEVGDAVIIAVSTHDNPGLRIENITIEGTAKKSARKALQSLEYQSFEGSWR